jgi:thioredoxin 1
MAEVIRLTDVNFEREVLQSGAPVLVDFWASWCPPCKMVEPVIKALARDYDGRLVVGKLHVDRNPRTRERYQVLGVPTFIVFQGGEVAGRRTGAQSPKQLERLLQESLGSDL